MCKNYSKWLSSIKRYYRRHLRPHRVVIVAAGLLSLVYFSIFLAPNYVTDSYAIATRPAYARGRTYATDGRIFSAAFEIATLKFLHLDFITAARISAVMAIANIAVAILICYRLYRYLAKARHVRDKCENNVVLFMLAAITIINPMTTELFSFFEKGIMTLSVLTAVLGAERFTRAIAENRRKDYIVSVTWGLVSVLCYQGTYGAYLVLMLFSIAVLASHNRPARVIKEIVGSCMAYGIPLAVDVIIVKLSAILLGATSRGISGLNPIGTLVAIKKWSGIIASFFYVVPVWLLPVFTSCLLAGAVIHSILHHSGKALAKFVVGSAAIWALSFCAAVWLTLGEDYRFIWFSPRVAFPLGMVFGLIGLWYYLLYAEYAKDKLLELLLAVFLAIELVKFNSLFVGRYQVNAIDRYRVEWLISQIDAYENISGRQVKRIDFYDDASPVKVDRGVTDHFDMNISAFSKDWSDVNAVSVYSGRYFERGQSNNAKMRRYCHSHDWAMLDVAQIYFDDDTMSVCKY